MSHFWSSQQTLDLPFASSKLNKSLSPQYVFSSNTEYLLSKTMIWRITAFVYETQAASDADSWDQHNTFFFSKQKHAYMYSTLYYRKKISWE